MNSFVCEKVRKTYRETDLVESQGQAKDLDLNIEIYLDMLYIGFLIFIWL